MNGTGQWLGVDWGSILLVFIVAMVATVAVVAVYSLGIRLLAVGQTRRDRPVPATVGAWACIAIAGLAVLYGVYLVIPLFHTAS